MSTVKEPSRGILLIATSHPQYGRMAVNLAMTIKAAEADMPIAVIADELAMSHLNEQERELFSHIIPAPAHEEGIKGAYTIRMQLPKLTSFDETLALDVDMLWLPAKKPSEIFALLADRDLTSVNEGYWDMETLADHTTDMYYYWADVEAVKKAYAVTGKLWQYRGEFLLFRNSKPVKAMFAEAAKIQAKPKVQVKAIGGGVSEEFAWSVASNLAGIEPHLDRWQPAYWPARHAGILPPVHQLQHEYYAVSFGGNYASRDYKRAYDILAGAAAYKLGLQYRFPLQSKRNYLTERKDI